jgi:hypothetical protein
MAPNSSRPRFSGGCTPRRLRPRSSTPVSRGEGTGVFRLCLTGHAVGFVGASLPILVALDSGPWPGVLHLQHAILACLRGQRPPRHWVGVCTILQHRDGKLEDPFAVLWPALSEKEQQASRKRRAVGRRTRVSVCNASPTVAVVPIVQFTI